ncbi:MAG: porin [Polyangiales bacterium]
MTAGSGRGLTVRTRDERFSLTVRARMQVRATLDLSMSQLAMNPTGADPLRAEFNLRRARLVFQGNAYTRALQYYVQLGVSPQDMESDLLIPLRDAYFTWTPHRYFAIRAGQMKVPFSRQRVISSGSQQFVDRSGTNAELNLDRDIGVQFRSDELFDHRVGYSIGVFGGGGRNRPSLDAGLLYVARLQFQPLGRFEDMDVEGDHKRTGPRLSIGIAGAFNHRTNRAQSTIGATYQLRRFDYAHATADLMFKWAGFSLQSEAILRLADSPGATGMVGTTTRTEYTRSGVGYMVQAAYQLPSHIEFGARWSHVIPIALDRADWGASALPTGVMAQDPGFHETHELGAVLNYYQLEHSVKLQFDYFYLFRNDASAGNHQLRLQAQVMF